MMPLDSSSIVATSRRAELRVGPDRLVLEVDDELVAVGQACAVERVAAPELVADVDVQLARGGAAVLLSLDVGRVALVEPAHRALPREQAQPRQLLRVAVHGHAEVTSLVAVLLVGEVDLAVIAAIRPAVEELPRGRQVARAEPVQRAVWPAEGAPGVEEWVA